VAAPVDEIGVEPEDDNKPPELGLEAAGALEPLGRRGGGSRPGTLTGATATPAGGGPPRPGPGGFGAIPAGMPMPPPRPPRPPRKGDLASNCDVIRAEPLCRSFGFILSASCETPSV